jgi:predicted ATP-dependent endonuclease of OLD family
LKEAFRDYSVNLDFPRVQSRRLFRDVKIRIEDEQLEDTLSHENVGEGMRRVLVFSMLRTIADLRDGSLSISNGDEEDDQSQPLLILYEEAELFLHPNLQKNMLRVFRSLCDSEAQIVFNTHSPVLIQNRVIDTINIVRDNSGTEVTQFHTVLEERDARKQSRLMDLQKISSYIFSDRVVLVEGQSDEIVLNKIASTLDSTWVFQSQNIPILELGGKNDLPVFKHFLEELGIEVFAVADVGALSRNIPKMVDDDSLGDKINGLMGKSGQISESGWKQLVVENHDQISSIRSEIREKLLEKNILVLMGAIEDYYPEVEAGNKIEAALEFSAEDYDVSELREHFVELPDRGETDVEVFLKKVFNQ